MVSAVLGSIRFQILVLILLVGIPTAGLAIYSSLERRADEEANTRAEVYRLAQAYGDRLETSVRGTEQFIRPIANFLGLLDTLELLNVESCQAAFAPFADGSNLDMIGAMLPDGSLLCAHEELPPGASLVGRPYAEQVLTATGVVVAPMDVSPLSGELGVPMLYPILNPSGEFIGAMVAMIPLDRFRPVDLVESLPEGGFATVTDGAGQVIARHPAPPVGLQEFIGTSVLSSAGFTRARANDSSTYGAQSAEGVSSEVGFVSLDSMGDQAFVFVGMPRDDAFTHVVGDIWRNSLGLALFTTIAFGIALVGTQRFIVGPVMAMKHATEQVAHGHLDVRLGPDYPRGELGELGRAFDSMATSIAGRTQEIQSLNEHLEQRVEERTAELEAANRELEAFSYSVSHDLRSPLRAIDGFAELAILEMGSDMPETAQRYLARVRAGTQRMGLLIDDLLQFSRVGRQELVRRHISLDTLMRESIEDMQPQGESRIEWRVGDLGDVDADPAMLRRVTDNLLGNAIKFSATQDQPVIEVGRIREGDETAFFVRDNGVGFDMAYADKLFGMFQRLHLPEEFEGTGVGLAIVQRVIAKHGGRVWADAQVGRGATFYFTLGQTEAAE